ncbi:bacterial transcriptional activator domain-containing protein [Streptomyces sp. NRRL S-37]|uniref:bacterial transcriptional activator domain-containing protein n=1 Tax=Streptomyces sp. NRRL S-37 TaxID=1463903 RepID=UPI001F1BD55A
MDDQHDPNCLAEPRCSDHERPLGTFRVVSAHPDGPQFVRKALTGCRTWPGRQGEALECYRVTTALLAEEPGAAPGGGLRQLHQRLPAAERPSRTGHVPSPPCGTAQGRFPPPRRRHVRGRRRWTRTGRRCSRLARGCVPRRRAGRRPPPPLPTAVTVSPGGRPTTAPGTAHGYGNACRAQSGGRPLPDSRCAGFPGGL